jgi:hypothetical protein
MRMLLSWVFAVGAVGLLGVGVWAQDKKEVTLKGEIACAKCTYHLADKCGTAISVKEDGKDVTYILIDKGMQEKYYEGLCGGDKKQATVSGTVTTKDGKKYVTPTKVEVEKKGAPKDASPVAATGCCCCGK